MNNDPTLEEVLSNNYLHLGAVGYQIIATMWSDYAEGRLDEEWMEATDTNHKEVTEVLLAITKDIINNGYVYKMRNHKRQWVELEPEELVSLGVS